MGTPVSLTDEQYRKERSKHPSVERMLRSLVIDGKEDLAVEAAAHAVENGEIEMQDLPYDGMIENVYNRIPNRPKLSKRLTDELVSGKKSGISLMGFTPTPEDHRRLLDYIIKNQPAWLNSYMYNETAPWTHQDLLDVDEIASSANNAGRFDRLLSKLPHHVVDKYIEQVLKEPLTTMYEGEPYTSDLGEFLFRKPPDEFPEKAANLLFREAIKRGEDKRIILASAKKDFGKGLVDVLDDELREILKQRFAEGHYQAQKGTYDEHYARNFQNALESRHPLQRAADFWHEYELDVEPHHFAVGKSLHTNQPETLTDHRGRTGTSEPHMGLLPKLRQYAKKVQETLRQKVEEGKIPHKKVNGKIYVKVYRGVAGDYAKSILDKVRVTDIDENGVVSPVYSDWDGTHVLKDTTIKIPAAHISSWTLAPHVAQNFADRHISGQADDGFIMSAYLPLESVIHDGLHDQFPNQPHAHRREQELVFHHTGDNQFHQVKTKNLQVRDEVGVYCPATVQKAPKKPKMAKSEYDPKELELGIQVEMEHTKDKKKAQEIAEEHLAETPDYYSKMKECGLIKVESKLVPESGPSKQLTVLHNLTQDNLLHAHELGGLPAPSLAVANINHPLSSFGEVTLVGHPDLVDPKKGAPTFDADIYSPRWPTTQHKVNKKAAEKFANWLAPHAQEVGESIDWGTVADNFVERGTDIGAHERKLQEAMKLAYLREKGHPIEVPYEPIQTQHEFITHPSIKDFFDKNGFQTYPDKGSEYHTALSNVVRAAIEDHYMNDPRYSKLDEEDRRDIYVRNKLKLFFDETGLLNFGTWRGLGRIVEDYKNLGKQHVDKSKLRDNLDTKIKELGEPEFERWATEKLSPISAGKFIAKWNTSRGGWSHKPYTIDNILYELTRTVRQGEDFNYGLGTARAAGAKKFRSLEAIRADAGRIVPSEEFKRHKEENSKLFDELHSLISPYATYSNTYGSLAQAIGDSYKRNGYRALEANGFRGVPPDVKRKFHEFAEKLVGSPTEYFESKPQRVVHLNEFHGAVVPHDVKPEVIEALKSHGIHNIETYDRSDEASRARALRNIVEHKNLYLSENTFDDLKKAIEHAFDGHLAVGNANPEAHINNPDPHAHIDQIDEYEDMQNGPEEKHISLVCGAFGGVIGGCTEKTAYEHNETGNRYLVKPYHGGIGETPDGWGEQTITDMYKSAGIPHLIQKSHVTNGVNEHGEEMPLLVIHMELHVISAQDMFGPNKLSDSDKHKMALDALKIQAIDFLTGNSDRHGNNLMFKLDRHTGKPVSPFAIDNSMWDFDWIKTPFKSAGFRQVGMAGDDLPAHFDDLGKWWQNYSPFIRNALQKNIPHLTQNQDYITSNFDKRCKELDDMFESLKRNPIGAP